MRRRNAKFDAKVAARMSKEKEFKKDKTDESEDFFGDTGADLSELTMDMKLDSTKGRAPKLLANASNQILAKSRLTRRSLDYWTQ